MDTPLSPVELRAAVESAKRAIAAGNSAEARAVLRNVVVSNPDDPDALAHYGVAAYMSGDPADARVALARAVRTDPDHLLGQKYLAVVSNVLGDFEALEIAASNAIRLAPRDVEALNMYGVARMHRLFFEEAAKSFSKAVEVAPSNVLALTNIEILSTRSLQHRRLFEMSAKIPAARTQVINRLRAALRLGQLDDEGLKNLLLLLAGDRDTFSAAIELARATRNRDNVSRPLADQLAAIFLLTGDLPGLLKFRRLAAELDPNMHSVQGYLAYANLIRGYDQWRECWKKFREDEQFTNVDLYAQEVPPWTGQRLGKKKILVYQEQGVGDAILALRLIPMLANRGVRFDLWVLPALAGLASTVKGYEALVRSPTRPDARSLGCDYASSLFGLISALDVDHEELIRNPTVVNPAADRVAEVRKHLRTLVGRRIGLAYGGNPARCDDWFRAVPIPALKPLADLSGIRWVNLVIDDRPDKPDVMRMFGMYDPMKEASDFEDTAAIISELDAVIAIDSSVAHLAGSLGKPVWVLVPPMLDWRWQIGSDTRPWWPNVTLLRSPEPGAWDGVIKDLTEQILAWR